MKETQIRYILTAAGKSADDFTAFLSLPGEMKTAIIAAIDSQAKVEATNAAIEFLGRG